jgi:hypothetical protein
VNSSAIIARQPDVPNLIVVVITELRLVAICRQRVSSQSLRY